MMDKIASGMVHGKPGLEACYRLKIFICGKYQILIWSGHVSASQTRWGELCKSVERRTTSAIYMRF